MAVGAGLVVTNNYYNQPLLILMAKTFSLGGREQYSVICSWGSFGLFLLFISDKFNATYYFRFIAIIFLLIAAISPSLLVLTIASFCIGFSSVVPQLFVPMAAQLANPKDKGRAIGIVMSGLLIGILGSRSISGYVGEYLGWRSMYFIASGIMLLYALVLVFKLPSLTSDFKGSYVKLMQSLWKYFKAEPSVRLAALRGGLGFAGFSAFWTTLVFLMEDNFNYGSGIAGMFGVLGIGGALAATWAGKLSDKMNKNRLITIATLVMVLAGAFLNFQKLDHRFGDRRYFYRYGLAITSYNQSKHHLF